MITNQQVKDALDECINERWKEIVKGATERQLPSCALCELFGGGNRYASSLTGTVPAWECEGCPVYLRNGGKGCADGSQYTEWSRRGRQERPVRTRARNMLKFLQDTRKHFFGGGVPVKKEVTK